MTKRILITVSFITAIIMLSCTYPAAEGLPYVNDQPPTNTSIPTQTLIPTVTPTTTNILLSDDFNVESAEMEHEPGSAEVKDGVYVVRSSGQVWKWGRSDSDFSDSVMEFDSVIAIGPANNNASAGVICRMQIHRDNSIDGYLFAINGDGFYSIHRITSSSMSPLVDWTYSGTINQGNQKNKVRATCNGSELKLEVNGELLATAGADASGPESGAFAFAAISFETAEPLTEVHFDNLLVTRP